MAAVDVAMVFERCLQAFAHDRRPYFHGRLHMQVWSCTTNERMASRDLSIVKVKKLTAKLR